MKKLEVIAVADAPISVDECRGFLRLFDSSHDAVLMTLRDAAIEFIEGQLREQIRTRTWRLTCTDGDTINGLTFSKWPVISIEEIKLAGVAQSLTPFGVNAWENPPKLTGTLSGSGDQVIEWKAGAVMLSAAKRLLILQMVADYHRQREATGGSDKLSIGTRLLLEGENQQIDAVRG